MRKNLLFISSAALSVLLFCTSMFAQSQFGEINGTVTDPNGAVVPNATVTLTGVSIGLTRSATTDSQGYYTFRQIPPGNYNLKVVASGFGERTVNNQTVVLETATPVNIQLSVAGAGAVVDVTSDELVAPVDTGSTKVQTSVTAAKIELLPKGVDFTSVLRAAPGTRSEGLAGGFSVDGASGSENVFVIDGQEVTNFRTGTLNSNNAIPTQFVQEVQIKSSGFEAEFGGATGGVINVVTKGGSNDFHGEFGASFNTPRFNGDPRDALVRFGAGNGPTEYIKSPKQGGYNFFPTANLAGPIAKDKLWFSASYSPQIFTQDVKTDFFTAAPAATRTFRFSETYRASQRYEYAFARLDAQPVDSLRLTGTFLWNPIINDGVIPFGTVSLGGTPASLAAGGTTYTGADLYSRQGGRQTGNNVTGQAIWTPSSALVASFRGSRGFLNQKGNNYFVFTGTSYRCTVSSGPNGAICPAGSNDPANSVTEKDISIRTNFEGDLSYFATLGGVRNEIKGGYQWFRIKNDVSAGYKNRGIIRFYEGYSIQDLGALSEPTCATNPCQRDAAGNILNPLYIGAGELIRFGTEGVGQNTNQSIYVQDKLQFGSRVTINAGVRFEKEDLPSFNGLAPPINFGWGDKIAPRLGFAIGLNDSGTAKIWGSYGKFYDRLKFELPRGSFGGDFYRWDHFEIFPNSPNWRTFTIQQIIGSFADPIGGACPINGFIAPNALSRCQYDYRISSNRPNADVFTGGGVDPDLKPFQQDEFTVGYQQEFARNFVFGSRFTWKDVKNAIEDAGILTAQGSEAYVIGNPGSGLHGQLLQQLGYARSVKPQRNYKAWEVSLDRRLANNFYVNVNYTWSRLYGNYSGLASSDENGRTSPGVNRFFDLPYIGFTYAGTPDNGLLATDRTHVVNSYGAYIFDWKGSRVHSTDFSYFQTFQSGTPQTTMVAFHASGTPIPLTRRGDLGRTEMFTQTDFAVSHKYKFGRDSRYTLAADLNVLNLFDESNVTSIFNTLSAVNVPEGVICSGCTIVQAINQLTAGQLATPVNTYLNGSASRKDSRYGLANGFQGPRSVRFGFRFIF
jgi:hypothetical protein